jgi:hypothetical protein
MTLPICAELPLIMLFSMVCTDDNGNVVDVTIDQPQTLGLEPTLFGFRHHKDVDIADSFSKSTISMQITGGSDNDNDNDNVPYCDLVPDGSGDSVPTCWDRTDNDLDTGLYQCLDGSEVKDYLDCKGGEFEDSDNIGERLGNLMETDNDEDNDEDDEPDRDVQNIGDELGELMK